MMRYKRPDKKNALSLLSAAKKDIDFTLTLEVSERSGATIVRNIYESFRMLGESLLAAKGIESKDHIMPIKELQEKIKQMSPEELKEFQKKQCIFCQIIAGKVQSKKIFEDNIAIGILDINPANPGHILLLPKEHYTIMPQLPEDVLSHLFMAAKALSNSMLRSLEVQGTNIIVANGVAAGQRAQHFMIHVIPRKENDGISFELPQKSIQMDELEKIGKKLVENLGSKVEDKEMPKPFVMPKKIVEAQFKEKPKEKEAKKAPIKKEKKSIEKIPKSSKENIDLDDIAKMLGVK